MSLFCVHSEPFSQTWPTSGTTRRGTAYVLPMSGHLTAGSASSSSPGLLPTPRTTDGHGPGWHGEGGQDLRTVAAWVLLKTPTAQLAVNGGSQDPAKRREGGHGPTLADEVEHLLPTPDATHGRKTTRTGLLLPGVAETLLPTPTAVPYGTNQSPPPGAAIRPSLDGVARLLPTPVTTDAKGTRNSTARRRPGSTANSGDTLTDILCPPPDGAPTGPPSPAGNASSDAPPPRRPKRAGKAPRGYPRRSSNG